MPSPASAPPAPSNLPRIVAASLIGTTIAELITLLDDEGECELSVWVQR